MNSGYDRVALSPQAPLSPRGSSPLGSEGSAPFKSEAGEGSIAQTAFVIWRGRRFIAKAAVAGLIVAGLVATLMSNRYEGTARLMPAEKQNMSGLAALLALGEMGNKDGGTLGAMGNSMLTETLGMKSSGALLIGVLHSRTVEDALINKFDLMKVYRKRYRKDAREKLEDNTEITEDRKSGIIELVVTDKSPQRAAAMARAYTTELNYILAKLNTSAAGRERAFIEERLKGVRHDLEEADKELAEFSSKNTTLDINEQEKAMVQSAATLQGELIAAEAQLSGLQQIYTGNNVRVRSARARIDELKRQIGQMKGSDDPNAGQDTAYPAIRKLPLLGVKYYDLLRNAKMQEVIFQILSKQYEMAKIQEAKELPIVRILDEPVVPEKKSKPHRVLMMLAGLLLGSVFGTAYLLVLQRWQSMTTAHTAKVLGLEMRQGFAEDVKVIREHLPLKWHASNGNGGRVVDDKNTPA